MTWAEFKKQVEAAGVTDDMDIRNIGDHGVINETSAEVVFYTNKGFGIELIKAVY